MIVYRTTGAWGSGLGANLSPAQVDGNFYDLAGRLATVEALSGGAYIVNITSDGTSLTVHMSDSSTYGPFLIPTASASFAPLPIGTITDADYTLVAGDASTYLQCIDVDSITVPNSDDVPFALGTEISFRVVSLSTGALMTFVGADLGVVINPQGTDENACDDVGATVTLKKVDTDSWDIMGRLAASVSA